MAEIGWLDPFASLMALAAVLALLIDRWLGEPPLHCHPVVWMGKYLSLAGLSVAPAQPLPPQRGPDWSRFCLGAVLWLAGALVVVAFAAWLQHWALRLNPVFGLLLLGGALKPLLAWCMLRNEVLAVESALTESLQDGRRRLARLVSRDVAQLSASEIRESAIESLAENLNDSLVAPLFWFALLGLPGAALYRFANTADAMWGYPGVYAGRDWAWGGKWAARADDALSWLPARITAVLLIASSPATAHSGRLVALRGEASRTPSPNSGWPMAAMALLLNVRLGKPGVYALNAAGQAPQPADTAQAACLAQRAVVTCAGCTVVLILLVGIVSGGLP